MSNIKLELRPPEGLFWFVRIVPALEISSDDSCFGADYIHLKYSLHIQNHAFSVKQVFKIRYVTDTLAAQMCGAQNPNSCRGGLAEYEVSFPSPQVYWQGTEKKIIRFLCWKPEEYDPDFNLQVDITSSAYSSGCTPEELQSMEGNVSFIAHVSRD